MRGRDGQTLGRAAANGCRMQNQKRVNGSCEGAYKQGGVISEKKEKCRIESAMEIGGMNYQ